MEKLLAPRLTDEQKYLDAHQARRAIAATGLHGFGIIYFPHYLTLDPAPFHLTMTTGLESTVIDFLEIIGYRGCTKSVWASLILVLYAALEKPDLYPFILPIGDTGLQVSVLIAAIKSELENNELLIQDYGHIKVETTKDPNPDPTFETDEEWQSKNLLLPNGVRILGRSRGQKVRGLRHLQHRPKLAVLDDVEDLEWVRKKENRDKTYRWFKGEVMPAMDAMQRKIVLVGNWLHRDALMARIKNEKIAKVLEIPALDPLGQPLWPSQFPTLEVIEKKKTEMGPNAWAREMQLKVIPDEGQIIVDENIHYYDMLPAEVALGMKASGLDPAISKKQTADYTAIVTAKSAWVNGQFKIYINKNPINDHLGVTETIAHAKTIDQMYPGEHIFFVEAQQYQAALVELMQNELLPTEAVHATTDKASRLKIAATFIKSGQVLFPRTGCEDLIIQLLGFGVEEHDDLVDALVMCIMGLIQGGGESQDVLLLG